MSNPAHDIARAGIEIVIFLSAKTYTFPHPLR